MARQKLNGRTKLIISLVSAAVLLISCGAAIVRHAVQVEHRQTTTENKVDANEKACSSRYETLHEGQRVMQEDIKKILEKL